MGLGDIVRTTQPVPVIVWRKEAAAQTIVAGDAVGFDAAGDIISGVIATEGPIVMRTTLTKTVSSVAYFAILIFGCGVMKAGAAIQPNKYVKTDANSDVIEAVQTISAIYVQAEIQEFWRILGLYLGLEADFATNDFALSDAANTNLIVVFVGYHP